MFQSPGFATVSQLLTGHAGFLSSNLESLPTWRVLPQKQGTSQTSCP